LTTSTNPKEPFDEKTAAYAASFPVVVPNGNHMRFVAPAEKNETAKLISAARQLKAINPNASVLFYLNTMMDWDQYDLHSWLLENHPEWWIVNQKGETVCLDAQPLFNLSIPSMRKKWLDTLTPALATGLFDGVFADRSNQLPKGHTKPKPASMNGIYDTANGTCVTATDPPFIYDGPAYDAWANDHASLVEAAEKMLPHSANYVIANNNATEGVGGRQFEKWCATDFDKATIVQDIEQLEQAGAKGQVALVHGGEQCNAAALALSLSAFLIGAGALTHTVSPPTPTHSRTHTHTHAPYQPPSHVTACPLPSHRTTHCTSHRTSACTPPPSR
jgi:hypothetical protein